MHRSRSGRFAATICSMSIFGASLCFDAYYGGHEPMRAFLALLIGWLAAIGGQIAWLANPLLLMSWVHLALGKHLIALLTSVAALLVAASFLLAKEIWLDEAGNMMRITGYGAGYWLWLASIIVAVGGSALGFIASDRAASS